MLTERLLDSLDDAIVLVEEPSGQQQQFIMVGRFGRGGLIKNVLGGVISGIADGGIGGGNILNHVAQSITGGGGGGVPGSTARAGPGTSYANQVTPVQLNFADALDTPLPDSNSDISYDPIESNSDLSYDHSMGTQPVYDRPDLNPQPYKWQRIEDGTQGPMAPTVPIPSNNFGPNSNYSSVPPGDFMGPVQPSSYGSGGCSCRPKYTCEQKCAYNAQMKEQCKPCRRWFKSQKKYIYPPKRRRTYRRRTYRRKYRRQ